MYLENKIELYLKFGRMRNVFRQFSFGGRIDGKCRKQLQAFEMFAELYGAEWLYSKIRNS